MADEMRGALTPEQMAHVLEFDPVSGPEVDAGLVEKAQISREVCCIAYVRSGGQTGADRGGLDAARDAGIPICGWTPRGGRAEDKGESPGLLAMYPELRETASRWYIQRTAWNARDSHATLIVAPGGIEPGSGTEATIDFACNYRRPWLVVGGPEDLDKVWSWLSAIGRGLTLNIAGPRASKNPAVYGLTYDLVAALLSRDRAESDGAPSDGAPSDGVPSDGAPSDGAPSDGAPSDGGLSL